MEALMLGMATSGIEHCIRNGMLPRAALRFAPLVADDIERRLNTVPIKTQPLDKRLMVRHMHAAMLNALDRLQATLARAQVS